MMKKSSWKKISLVRKTRRTEMKEKMKVLERKGITTDDNVVQKQKHVRMSNSSTLMVVVRIAAASLT